MQRIATLTAAAAALALAAGARPARAEGADLVFDPLSMDSFTTGSKLDASLAYVLIDDSPLIDATVVGIDLRGQYVSRRGYGGYVALPLTYLDGEVIIFEDSTLAVGNLELGGLYSKFLTRSAAIVARAGLVLPTAADDGIAVTQLFASPARYGDLVLRRTDSSWLRVGASPMGRIGKLLWRADIGLDLALDEPEGDGISPVLHLGLGGGVDLGTAQLLAELVTVVVDEDDADTDSNSASSFSFGARFVAGNLRPGIAIVVPIDYEPVDLQFSLVASLVAHL